MSAPGAVAVWLRARSPEPPSQLRSRMDELVTAVPVDGPPADALIDVAVSAMSALLSDGCLTRDSALGLLAVDAIVTYAFEAAAEEPERIEARTRSALARIAALANADRA